MFIFYSFLLAVGFTLALPYFLFLAWRDGKYTANFRERLGFLPYFKRTEKPVIWVHCVSVGETNAAKPLIKEILRVFPQFRLVVSTTTLTGQKTAREIFKNEADFVFYFPFDFRFAVRRALQIIQPQAVLIMETEIWFNFLRECRRQNIKTAIVNGRLSEKSFNNYRLIRPIVAKVLQNLDLALMQTEADAERLANSGFEKSKIFVTGNLKFDIEEIAETVLTTELKARFAFDENRKLIVAASTHAPEEHLIIRAFAETCEQFNNEKPRLLLIPRHPERFAEVAQVIENSGFTVARRSAVTKDSDKNADIILLDSVGELRQVLPLAEIVFVGGSLIKHGGQNILEPAAARKPIITGFYTFNFKAIVEELSAAEALIRLPEVTEKEAVQELSKVFAELLQSESRRKKLAANAFHTLQKNRGATVKTVENLHKILG